MSIYILSTCWLMLLHFKWMCGAVQTWMYVRTWFSWSSLLNHQPYMRLPRAPPAGGTHIDRLSQFSCIWAFVVRASPCTEAGVSWNCTTLGVRHQNGSCCLIQQHQNYGWCNTYFYPKQSKLIKTTVQTKNLVGIRHKNAWVRFRLDWLQWCGWMKNQKEVWN